MTASDELMSIHELEDGEKVRFFDRDTTLMLEKSVANLCASDRFVIDEKDALSLMDLWLGSKSQYATDVPADLFFSETLPITDCEIALQLPEINREMMLRVCIYPDYKERIEGADFGEIITIGLFMYYLSIGVIAVPLGVQIGRDSVAIQSMTAGFGVNEFYQKDFSNDTRLEDHLNFVHESLCSWYGIQITLLHPRVTESISRGTRTKIRIPKKERTDKKRITRYIRVHQIKKQDIEEMMTVGRGITRRTLAWYVIGHWRNLPGGGRTFVHPYWKGPCRSMKRNLDEGRDRLIVMPEEGAI